MEKQVSPGLSTLFLVYAVLVGLFGLVYLAIPEVWGTLLNLPMKQPRLYRVIGAALGAFAASSWLASKETAWERVKIVVQTEIMWTVLGSLVLLWGLVFGGFPRADSMNLAFFTGFAAAFGYFYLRR